MSHRNPPQPIVAAFRAAGRLVNEWRDTALLAGAVLADGVANRYLGTPTLAVAGGVMALRELCRGNAWTNTPEMVGLRPPSLPSVRQCSNASWAGANSAAAALSGALALHSLNDVTITQPLEIIQYKFGFLMLATATAGFSAVAAKDAGGRDSVFRAYRDVMWDHPRKQGGPTETGKLRERLAPRTGAVSLAP